MLGYKILFTVLHVTTSTNYGECYIDTPCNEMSLCDIEKNFCFSLKYLTKT